MSKGNQTKVPLDPSFLPPGKDGRMISGANIAGGNGQFERVEQDYYATPPEAVRKLLDAHWFCGKNILEPCVGAGHIADVVKHRFPEGKMTCIDIVNRGYPGTVQADFLAWGGVQRI